MPNSNSLTIIFHKIQEGDDDAANQMFQQCFPRLLMYARKHLEGVPQKMADCEDVALSALNSFIKAARLERFPDFKDREDLWRLLFSITKRKAIDLRRYESRRKAGGESAFLSAGDEKPGIQQIPADLSEEQFAALISESLEHNLVLLDPHLCQFAIAKLEGYSNLEISEKFGVALRTVERKLHRIRRIWMERNEAKQAE